MWEGKLISIKITHGIDGFHLKINKEFKSKLGCPSWPPYIIGSKYHTSKKKNIMAQNFDLKMK